MSVFRSVGSLLLCFLFGGLLDFRWLALKLAAQIEAAKEKQEESESKARRLEQKNQSWETECADAEKRVQQGKTRANELQVGGWVGG